MVDDILSSYAAEKARLKLEFSKIRGVFGNNSQVYAVIRSVSGRPEEEARDNAIHSQKEICQFCC